MIRVAFCCYGNICRSTMSESVFTYKVSLLGIKSRFRIDSFATSTEELGSPPHYGTQNKLRSVNIPVVPHRAKQISWSDYESFDYIIGMDEENIRALLRILRNDPDGKVKKLLSFAGLSRNIADPWYTGNFDETYEDIQIGCDAFLSYLKKEGKI